MISKSLFLYLSVEIISLVLFFASTKTKKMNSTVSKILLIMSLVPVLSIVVFRAASVGTDYEMYEVAYGWVQKEQELGFVREWLGGFYYVFRILSGIFKYNVVLAIINSASILLFYVAAYRQKEYPVLYLAIIFSFCLHLQALNQFRQTLSLAICLLNIENAQKKNLKKFIILQLLATIFHSSSLILIPIYYLSSKAYDRKAIVIYGVISLAAIIAPSVLFYIVSLTNYGERYFGGRFDYSANSSLILLILRTALLITVLIARCVQKNKQKASLLFHMATICVLLQILTVKSYVFSRLTTYYYLAYVPLIPALVSDMRIVKKQKTVLLIAIVIALLIYKIYYYNAIGSGAGLENYRFVWDE